MAAPYRTYADETLIALLREGEKKAFNEIYERYWNKLFVAACYRMGNPGDAEDIVQDIMVRLWSNRGTLIIKVTLGAYLATAVKYEVINRLAKQKRREQHNLLSSNIEADYSTERTLDFTALQERLAILVKALPEKCRMAFTLSREHGFSQKEIASYMDISENTVESHLKKAIKSLKTGLRNFIFNLFY